MERDFSLHRCERNEYRVLLRAFENLLRDVAIMSAIPNAFDQIVSEFICEHHASLARRPRRKKAAAIMIWNDGSLLQMMAWESGLQMLHFRTAVQHTHVQKIEHASSRFSVVVE